MAIGRGQQLQGRVPSAGDEHAGNVVAEGGGEDLHAVRRVEALEIADFTFTEDQDARRLEVRVEPCQRETGLLDVGTRNRTFEARGAAEELERKANGFGPALQQACNRDRPLHHLQSSIFNLAIDRQIED